MNLAFPSIEFDHAVEAACHGTMSEEQARALNVLLRGDRAALDEYILRVELHSRLASEPDLFPPLELDVSATAPEPLGTPPRQSGRGRFRTAGAGRRRAQWALVAGLILAATGWWAVRMGNLPETPEAPEPISAAVAMLNGSVDAMWEEGSIQPRRGAPLEPG